MRKKNIIVIFIIIIFTLMFYNTQSFAAVSEIDLPVLTFAKTQIYPGDFLMFYVENIESDDEVIFDTPLRDGKTMLFDYAKRKAGLFSVHYTAKAGIYPVELRIIRAGRIILKQEQTIILLPKEFPTQHLQVSSKLQAKRDQKLIELDALNTNEAISHTNSYPLWEDNFVLPLTGRITTEYGLIRYINDEYSGRHSGIDIAANRGTAVMAANSGIVNLAGLQYVTGNTVIIDHGFGVSSSYAHLDKFFVKPGDAIQKGQIIGQVGSTGFSTGPHLHWTVRIGATFVNPWLFIEGNPLNWLSAAN